MREIFFEYFKPSKGELKQAWSNGLFSFDSNVLLNLYRYSSKTSNDLFRILEFFADRIRLTHQATLEFLDHRTEAISKQTNAYDEVKNVLDESLNGIISKLNNYKRHSTIEVDKIITKANGAIDNLKIDIDNFKKHHPAHETKDDILERLEALSKKRIGLPFESEELEKIFKEGKGRYDKEVPPGYKDRQTKKNSSDHRLYGDLILWKQIIKIGKEEAKPIIFVTDDLKDDWWEGKINGESQGARRELLREFFHETGQHIYIYQSGNFLDHAKKLGLGKSIDAESIKEIRDVRLGDQQLEDKLAALTQAFKSPFDINAQLATQFEAFENPFAINAQLARQLEVIKNPFAVNPELMKLIQAIKNPFAVNEELMKQIRTIKNSGNEEDPGVKAIEAKGGDEKKADPSE